MNQIVATPGVSREASRARVALIHFMASEAFKADLAFNPFVSGSEDHRIYADAMLDLQTGANHE